MSNEFNGTIEWGGYIESGINSQLQSWTSILRQAQQSGDWPAVLPWQPLLKDNPRLKLAEQPPGGLVACHPVACFFTMRAADLAIGHWVGAVRLKLDTGDRLKSIGGLA
jgi:hypothetical protein